MNLIATKNSHTNRKEKKKLNIKGEGEGEVIEIAIIGRDNGANFCIIIHSVIHLIH